MPSQCFQAFTPATGTRTRLRSLVTAAWRVPESAALAPLMEQARLPGEMAEAARQLALRLADKLRKSQTTSGRAGMVQSLLQEFSLSSQEGVALMCLAEALLRIPDAATRDALIRDKIARGQWQSHLGKNTSLFVNAATWGLLVSGRLMSTHSETGLTAALGRLLGKGGEPLIRKGLDVAMRMMGEQFVAGQTIAEALGHAQRQEDMGFRYSYDMLGEAALTAHDAWRYLQDYERAIHVIGKAASGKGVYDGAGISIKLSALRPRYSRAQYERVMTELYPALLHLTLLACRYDIGINIDAEESDRLELSLDLFEKLCWEPALAGWNGIGFVIQAYQKRCPFVIDHLLDLARRSKHRLMIRLVKGAYWDSEIKRAQIDGMQGYSVFTRKAYTDVSYIACARKLLAAPDAFYPQFATHNAHTLAAIYHLAEPQRYTPNQYEFQCLHGMGEPLYTQIVGSASGRLNRSCRIYAPVGTHETLLAYLVRRLLENGANTSFVNRIADPAIPLESLVLDPVQLVEQLAHREGLLGLPHPAIPLPQALYGARRPNSAGLDLANDATLEALGKVLRDSVKLRWRAQPLLAVPVAKGETQAVLNPANHQDVVGVVQQATAEEVDLAVGLAVNGLAEWSAVPPERRGEVLEQAANRLQEDMQRLMGLLVREAGKTCASAIAEVREAVDFLRFYAAQASQDFDNQTHLPLGPVVCISPWNFPLSIFTGQLAAALAAGNTVLAKPAEQTPLIAAEVVRVLWAAGVPRTALQLLPGLGAIIGARLVGDARVQGVMFTGSTEVARLLRQTLAHRLDARGRTVPLIAETGGQNVMIVDSSALTEQVVADVLASAFDSAGQRCSALRMLCVQEELAERVLDMLKGAMAELRTGNPDRLATDVGPLIDADAQEAIQKHIDMMRGLGKPVYQPAEAEEECRAGNFVAPALIELESFSELKGEVFGPVLHVLRYASQDLGKLLEQINGSGYGLTLGLHTRIDETIARVVNHVRVGNIYVNRNMVGAVVGVQPFGGEGLSGTGPKAGGPLYLYRLLSARPEDAAQRALASISDSTPDHLAENTSLGFLRAWFTQQGKADLALLCDHFGGLTRAGCSRVLRGPTGERNVYTLLPRRTVLCLADRDGDLLVQLIAITAVGSRALWPSAAVSLHCSLPAEVRAKVEMISDWRQGEVPFDAVLHHGSEEDLRYIAEALASLSGPLVAAIALRPGQNNVPLERLLIERALSVNTAAAGGDAGLMSIG